MWRWQCDKRKAVVSVPMFACHRLLKTSNDITSSNNSEAWWAYCCIFPCVFCAYVVYVCTWAHVYMCMYVRAREPRRQCCSTGADFVLTQFETGFYWSACLLDWAGWPARSRLRPVLASPQWDNKCLAPCLAFLCGFWGSNSGPHAWLAHFMGWAISTAP